MQCHNRDIAIDTFIDSQFVKRHYIVIYVSTYIFVFFYTFKLYFMCNIRCV